MNRERAEKNFWFLFENYWHDAPTAHESAERLRDAVRRLDGDQRYAAAAGCRLVLEQCEKITAEYKESARSGFEAKGKRAKP